MPSHWLGIFFRFSGYTFSLKQKIVQANSWYVAILYAVFLMFLELIFAIISLPLYLLVPPAKVQEDGVIFPINHKDKIGTNTYAFRRKISLSAFLGAGGIFLTKVIFIGIISLFLFGAQKLLADTQDWTFDTSTDYTTSSSSIEIVSGVARLKDIGSTSTGSTTNSGFDSGSTGWTYADWGQGGGEVNIAGARVTSGGNPGAYINISAPAGSGDELGGYWRQSFITSVANPSTTINFDWSVSAFDTTPLPVTFKLYVFVDTGSGVPTIGQEVWSSGEISGTSGWVSVTNLDVSSKVTTAGTYYLKVAMWVETPGSTSGPFTVGYDNIQLNWAKITQLYDATKPVVYPLNSLTMSKAVSWNSFNETATKNGGEIYYQLSGDDGSTWKYWDGLVWATAGGTNYNTAADINTNIPTFATSTNQIKWKAFLSSNGSQQVTLDNIAIGYTQNQPPSITNLVPTQDTQYGYVYINYNLLDTESDPSSLIAYEYSLTGAFTGEQITMVASTTDPNHNGVSGLAASPAGVGHTFVWDARSQLGDTYNSSVYVRLRPDDNIQSGSYSASTAIAVDYVSSTVANVSASETVGTTNVEINYDLFDNTADNILIELQISGDGGVTWTVPATTASGSVGTGVTSGNGKTITWNAGIDYAGQQKDNVQVRVRAKDKWQNQGTYTSSTNFSLDTLAPVTLSQSNLQAQPNAGDMIALIGGSFTETNPNTNDFYVAINGGSYSSATTGDINTAAPSNQATAVGATLDGDDYISAVKIIHIDDYGSSFTNENNSPNTVYKYVKPYTPQAPILSSPITTQLNLAINPHVSEINTVEYVILETTQNKYVQTDGTLGDVVVWQTAAVWGTKTITGLSSPVANYIFKVKSRNPSDTAHTASSESAFSATAQIVNTAPSISFDAVDQTTDGTQYVAVNYTGTDEQGDLNNIFVREYSQDNTSWSTATEKSSVGSDGTTGLVFLSAGSAHDFMWDSGSDLSNIEDSTVYFRLRSTDTLASSTLVTTAAFKVDNKAPVVSNVIASQNAGARAVTFTYDLTDNNNSIVELDISEDGGSSWIVTDASVSGDVGAGITPGTGKTVIWNAGTDFDNQYQTDLVVRVRARDVYGNQGSYTSSANFTVDTNDPVVSNVTAVQDSGADTFTFYYDVSEDAGDVNVVLAISSNGGSTWVVATSTASGSIGSVVPGTGKTITWNGSTDYNNQEKTNMRIRITATDQFSNTGNNTSGDFLLDTYTPRVTDLSAIQTIGTTNVSITYTLADQNTSLIEVDISEDGGSSWNVTDTGVTGDVGLGITAGNKTITWAAGTDFDEQQQSDIRVRVRAKDIFNHQSANVESANFALDTLNPSTNVLTDLLAQPNAGDTTVLLGGSFVETNPNTNNFYIAINGGVYSSSTAGSTNTASPVNQATAVGATLDGNDYISKVKIVHADDFGQTYDNENLIPTTTYKYVKPYTPPAPTVNNPTVGTVDVLINPHTSETTGLEYAIYESSQNKYVQIDGTLGASAVWQTLGVGAVTVNGLTTHSYLYQFQIKSRNTSDGAHAVSSESALSSGASSANQSPTIAISPVSQTTDGTKVVTINYSGIDLESETASLVKYQYSTDNATWYTMTEKSGVGSDGTTGLAFSPGGTTHDFVWDVASDLSNTEDSTVYIRLQANDGTSDGGIATTGAFTIDTKDPVISAVTGVQVADSNNVTLTYILTDLSNSNVDIGISEDAGLSWNVVSSSVTGDVNTNTSPGSGKSVVWNAGVNFDGQEQNDIRVKFRAVDAFGNQGSYTQSSNFSLDTKNPTVANVTASQNSGLNTVTITYDLADANNSTVQIDVSEDGGLSWNVTSTSVTGHVGTGVVPGIGKSIVWDAGSDFSGQDQADLQVRVRATDTYANLSDNVQSANFSLDTLAPAIYNVFAMQTVGTTTVSITYDLVDSDLVNIALDISENSGLSWIVPDTAVTGVVGAGISGGNGKTITWNAGVDFDEQAQADLRVRIRGTDTYNNTSSNAESADFALDTLNPAVNATANLQSQPNAGDTTAAISGSFIETNPNTNIFYLAINGGAYGSGVAGDVNTASPSSLATAADTTLTGNDYISKVKIVHTDDFSQTVNNENTSPNSAYKYVKPYTPSAPTVNNPQNTSVDLVVNANTNESSSVEYEIFENFTGKYVQADGSLDVGTVWQTTSTWSAVTVTGLTSPVARYSFKVKARNPSDATHAASSESDFSAVGAIVNSAPSINISSVTQVGGDNYAVINYTGTDIQNDTNDISVYQYSTDNINWYTMTEKSGVGSSGTNNIIYTSGGASLNFAWDVNADLPNTQDPTVYVRLQSTDSLVSSAIAQSSAFAIDTLGPVISNIVINQNTGTDIFTFNYDLADQSVSDNNILLQISSDSGSTWTVATTTLSGDVGASVTAGTGRTVTWNAGTDYNNQEKNTMRLRLRGTDQYGNTGNTVSSSDFTLDTKTPTVSNISIVQTMGDGIMNISYTITDITAGGNFVEAEFSEDGGTTWNVVATTLYGDIGAGVLSGDRTFNWDAGTDFSSQEQSDMRVRIRARDYFGHQGSYLSSDNFAVDTKGPVISGVVALQTAGTKDVNVSYNLSDISTTSLAVQMDISEDDGSNWTVATTTLLGDIGSGQSTGNGKLIVWNAGIDFPGQYSTDMKIRLRSTDKYSNQSSPALSSAFTVDTVGPIISNITASQVIGSNNVSIHYDLADNIATNLIITLDISSDGGSSWAVVTSTLAGNIGTDQTTGTDKIITWNAGIDFSEQYSANMQIRIVGVDSYSNAGSYASSSNFTVDTNSPITFNSANLISEPNAGDTTVLVGGSFTENNPNTNNFYAAVNGLGYGSATLGQSGTATPADQATALGVTLDGDDYISKVKIVHTDIYNNSGTNENTNPSTANKYVKPYQPAAPTVSNPGLTTVDVVVNKNPAEVSGLEYAIYCSTTAEYVQVDGSLGTSTVWQTGAIWGTVTVTGLSSPVANYIFKTKSRNTSDLSHATSSESVMSAGALAGDVAPVITIDYVSQVAGNNYVMIDYTGIDADNNTVNLVGYQYSSDNSTWFTMTEKNGVGSNGKTNLAFTVGGAPLKFAWDANADLINIEDSTVYIRLQGNDAILDGNLALSPSFALDLRAPQISGISSAQQSGTSSVLINYDLSDLTLNNIIVALDISEDNGSTWTVATSTLSGAIGSGQSAGSGKLITWNAGVDFNDQFSAGVMIRLRTIDSFNNQSGNVVSTAFTVDTLVPVISSLAASQVGSVVNITYNLDDDTTTGLITYLDVSEDGGSTWTVATSTLSGAIGSGQSVGNGKLITWDVGVDFDNQYNNQMMVRIRAVDAYDNRGSYLLSSGFVIDTNGPIVTNVYAIQNLGNNNIEITYHLSDDSSSNNIPQFEVSSDGGVTWNVPTTTYSGSINQSVSTGTSTFIWNASIDYNEQEKTNMRVRVRARDIFENFGSYSQSSDFSLDTLAPIVTNVTALQTVGTHNINISYDLFDGTGADIVMEVSSDGGVTWTVPVTAVTGDIGDGVSIGTDKTITWNGLVDLPNQELANARVRIRATDGFANVSANFSSSDFVLDTKTPSGLASLNKFSSSSSTLTLNWTPASDSSFDHYEIWYGPNEVDVQNRATTTATKWTTDDDPALNNANTISTVIAGIIINNNLYAKIWAIDRYGNETTVNDINLFAPAIVAPVELAGGGGGIVSPIKTVPRRPILTPLLSPTISTKISIFGLADPRTRIDLYDNEQLIERLNSVVDDNGQFSQDFVLDVGSHVLTVKAVDFDNNISASSEPVNLDIVTSILTSPIIVSPQNIIVPSVGVPVVPAPTIGVELPTPPTPPASLIRLSAEAVELPSIAVPEVTSANIVTANNNLTFSGTSLPDQDIVVYIHSNQALIYRTRTDNAGVWKINHSQSFVELTPGQHTIYAVAVDANAKVKSRPSIVSSFIVEKNFWVMFFNYLNWQTTSIALVVLGLAILWLYRIRNKRIV